MIDEFGKMESVFFGDVDVGGEVDDVVGKIFGLRTGTLVVSGLDVLERTGFDGVAVPSVGDIDAMFFKKINQILAVIDDERKS